MVIQSIDSTIGKVIKTYPTQSLNEASEILKELKTHEEEFATFSIEKRISFIQSIADSLEKKQE